MNKKDKVFNENMIKGRIAESLIEQLFLQLGYSVYRFGMENTIPGIMNKLQGSSPKSVVHEISKMPDFIIKHPTNNKVHQIEVKFRKGGNFSFKNIGNKYYNAEDYPYKDAYFVVVSKSHIKYLSYEDLKNGKTISSNYGHYFNEQSEFVTDRETVLDFCEFAVKFFECVE